MRDATTSSRVRIARFALITVVAGLTTGLAGPPAVAETTGPDDPNLTQTLAPDLAVVHGEHVLQTGHVDMGPKYDKGQWRFLVHDDAARADADATSVWRYPEETVMRVLDEGKLTVPDDPDYEFLGAEPGNSVWVVPQTQNTDVVWLGWSTQDPEVMKTIDRGVTLSLTGVQGPGTVTVYLQSGSFGEPQVLWDSRKTGTQPIWVDVNTHTHANWVFTTPGVYLLRLTAAADLVDGGTVSDTQLIRFAVGTGTPTADALAAVWTGPDAAASTPDGVTAGAAPPTSAQDPLVPLLIGAIAVVAAGLVTGVVVVVARGARARKRVLAGRSSRPSDEPADDPRGQA